MLNQSHMDAQSHLLPSRLLSYPTLLHPTLVHLRLRPLLLL